MTTVHAPNVHVVRYEGEGDDMDAPIKALALEGRAGIIAINSINIGRVVAQTVHHAFAVAHFGGEPVDLVVPSGALGNATAALWVQAMGLPVRRVVLATNSNDIVARAAATGAFVKRDMAVTVSEAMNVQIPYNYERILHLATGTDAARVRAFMDAVECRGEADVPGDARAWLAARADATAVSNADTLAAMRSAWEDHGYLADPHTAVGLCAAWRQREAGCTVPIVVCATAHAAKFEEAVCAALGRDFWDATVMRDLIPERARRLYSLPESPSVACFRRGEDWEARLRDVLRASAQPPASVAPRLLAVAGALSLGVFAMAWGHAWR